MEAEYAYAETLDIIKHMDENLLNKIPKKIIQFLEENAAKDYIVDIDYSKPLIEISLKEKTISIIAVIYLKCLCNEKQKKDFIQVLKENEKIYIKEINEKYNLDNIFKNTTVENKELDINETKKEETSMIEYKEKGFWTNIIEKVKNIFKIKK